MLAYLTTVNVHKLTHSKFNAIHSLLFLVDS